jgi:hypothetical protein
MLVAEIRRVERRPIVVASMVEGRESPDWDIEGLASRLDGDATIFLLDSVASYELTEQIGGRANSVHSGWVRIYPSPDWQTGDQNRNRIAPYPTKPHLTRIKIVERIATLSWQAHPPRVERPKGLVEDSVQIEENPSSDPSALLSGRCESDSVRHAIIRYSALYPGIPANRLFKRGMVLKGKRTSSLFPDFYPDKPYDDLPKRMACFIGEIVCTWVLVKTVNADRVEVLFHPEVSFEIRSETRDLSEEYSEGVVVKVYIMAVGSNYEISAAPDDEIATEPISAIPGGPPWLSPPSHFMEEEEFVHSHTDGDDSELVEAYSSIEKLQFEVSSLKDKLRASRAKLIPQVHPSDEACLRAAIVSNYNTRLTASDRTNYPMLDVTFDREFFTGFAEVCNLVPYETVLRAIVNIAVGHPQTETEKFKPGSRFSEEIDGWQIRRGHVADATSGAPRIRFAKKGSSIRFEHVGHHDDDL